MSVDSVATSASDTITTNVDVPAGDTLLILAHTRLNTTTAVTSVANDGGLGVTPDWVSAPDGGQNGADHQVRVYASEDIPSGTAFTLNYDQSPTRHRISAIGVPGLSDEAPGANYKGSANGTGGTPSATTAGSDPASGDLAVGTWTHIGAGANGETATPTSGFAEQDDHTVTSASPYCHGYVETQVLGAGGAVTSSPSFGSNSGGWLGQVVVYKQAAGGSTYTLDVGHVASVEAPHGVTTVADAPVSLGHAASEEAPYGVTLTGVVPAPLVRPEYTGTPRFVLDATGETILLRGANTILTASDAVSKAAVNNGANAMRLVLNWHVLEPTAPTGSGTDFSTYTTSLDATTLSEIDALCQWYADQGAYVLLDFHQASWSPYYAGSGVPDWYYTDSRFTAQQNGGAGWNNSTDKSTAIKSWWTDATESPMSQQLYINFVTAFIEWAQAQPWYDHVFGYTTFNELNAGNMTGSSASKISSMHAWLAPVVAAMNTLEPDRALFVMCRGGAQGWGTATFTEFGDLAAQNICAEFHQYYTGLAPGVDADAPVDLTPTYVQEGNASGNSGGSDYAGNVTVVWPSATGDGSLLLLVITQRNSGGATAPTTPTVSGWTQIQTKTFSGSGGVGRQTVFKIEYAASRSGSETIDLTPAGAASHTRYVAAQVLEYADAGAVDVIATATTGTDQTVESPASGALAQGGELALAFVGQLDNNNNAPASPTGGFAIRRSAGTTASGSGCYNTVLEQVTPDAASVSTTVDLTSADGWVAQIITFTPQAGVAGVGYDSTGDDYYPDSNTVHNTTAGSAYAGDEQYQEAFLGVPLAKAAELGIPAFLGEYGVHYDDTGRLDYVADMTVAMDSLGLSGTVWKLGVPPGDSLAICSDSAGTLNDVGSAWSTWWLATDFTPGTDAITLHIGHVPVSGDAFGVDLASTLDLPVGHAAAVDAAYGVATPASASVSLGHITSLETPRGLALSAVLAQLDLAPIPQRSGALCKLGVSNQVLGGQDLHAVEATIGRQFVGLRQNQNLVTAPGWTSADNYYDDYGYRLTYRDIQLDDVGSWADVVAGVYDSNLTTLFTNLMADGRWGPLNPAYCAFTHEMSLVSDEILGAGLGAGTAQDYINAARYVRLFADAMGASLYSVTGEYLGGPIVWCLVGWDRMFVGSGGVGGPDAGVGIDDFDPDLGTSPAPAGTSYYELIGSDVYNSVLTPGTLKYGNDAATLLQPIVDAAVARGKDWMIGEWACGDGDTTTDHTNKAAWIDSFRTFISAIGAGPNRCVFACSTVKLSADNYQPDSSAESLAAWRTLANDEYFTAGLDRAYGLSAGVTLALPIGYISATGQAFGIGFGAVHLLDIGYAASVEVANGVDLVATLAQLGIGHVPSASASHGVTATATTALLIGHAASSDNLYGVALGAAHQLPVGHIPAADTLGGLSLAATLGLPIGHVPGASAGYGIDLLLLGRPTLFRLVACYSGSRTMSPFLPHQVVHLASAHAFDVSLDLDAHVELEQAAYEVDL